jgi:hypothetical protein
VDLLAGNMAQLGRPCLVVLEFAQLRRPFAHLEAHLAQIWLIFPALFNQRNAIVLGFSYQLPIGGKDVLAWEEAKKKAR